MQRICHGCPADLPAGRKKWCADCAKKAKQAAKAAWKKRNPEKLREYDLAAYQRNIEARRAAARARYAADPERALAASRRWYYRDHEHAMEVHRASKARRRDHIAAYRREWYLRNRDRALAYARQWLDDHPGRNSVNTARRRARLAAAEGSFTTAEFEALVEASGSCCTYCGVEGRMTADHIIPLSRGGSNDIANITPACLSCNCRKGAKTADEYMAVA